jgi:hypothetical protein
VLYFGLSFFPRSFCVSSFRPFLLPFAFRLIPSSSLFFLLFPIFDRFFTCQPALFCHFLLAHFSFILPFHGTTYLQAQVFSARRRGVVAQIETKASQEGVREGWWVGTSLQVINTCDRLTSSPGNWLPH